MAVSMIRNLEESFNSEKQHVWFMHNWWLAFIFSAVYFVCVFSGRAWMEARHKFELRRCLAAWSAGLALFSIVGALVTIQDCINYVSEVGWHSSVCDASIFDGKIGFWVWLFILSKVPELGDTIFIVLRKQKLMFLHWYHHITVLLYAWYSYRDHIAPARYFVTINFTVHAVMYSYYALRAAGIVKIPRQVNITITLMQLLQMVVGCVVNVYALQQLRAGKKCDTTMNNIVWSLIMYFSYFLLFAHFFYNAYITGSPSKKHKSTTESRDFEKGVNGHPLKKE